MNVLTFPLKLAGPVSPNFTSTTATQQCQVSDGGIDVVIQVLDGSGVVVNVRPATKMNILVVSPSGVVSKVPASYFTNGFDGQIYFATGTGTPFGAGLNESGEYRVQAQIILSGNLLFTTIGSFSVLSNLSY